MPNPFDPNDPYGTGDAGAQFPLPPPYGGTPPYFPGQNPGTVNAPQRPTGVGGVLGAVKPYIPTAIGAGLTLGGNILDANAKNLAAQRQWQILQSEMSRRNAIQSGIAPGLMTSAGITDPTQRAQIMGASSGQTVGENFYPGATSGTPGGTPGTSTGPSVGGVGAPGPIRQTLSNPALGAATLGIAPAIGALRGTAHLNANDIVKSVENPFGQAMANSKSLQDLKTAYANYLAGIQNFKSTGGANAQVAQQSLNNPKLGQTFQTLWQQFGGGQAPSLGQPAS